MRSTDNYSTPILVPVEGKLQLVVSGGDYVTGHDLGSGKELWRLGGFNPNKIRANRTISSSVAVGDLVFTSSRSADPAVVPAGKGGGVAQVAVAPAGARFLQGRRRLWRRQRRRYAHDLPVTRLRDERSGTA